MSARKFLPVVSPTEEAVGASTTVRPFSSAWLMLWGTFVATIDVEIEVAPEQWVAIATLSAPNLATPTVIPGYALRVRLNVTAYTSGQPLAGVSGPGIG